MSKAPILIYWTRKLTSHGHASPATKIQYTRVLGQTRLQLVSSDHALRTTVPVQIGRCHDIVATSHH
jgi:hypothetical protein